MSRRADRVGSLIRQILGQVLLSKLSDPRVDPARTSITRVEVPEDLLTARVYVSVMGTEAQQRTALRALRHAGGRIQELLMRQMSLRHTPVLRFELDKQFKKTLQILQLIEQAMAEIRQKELARRPDQQAGDGQGPPSEPSKPAEPAEQAEQASMPGPEGDEGDAR